MWMSMPTPVTNSSQIEDSGSSRKPASALNCAAPPCMRRCTARRAVVPVPSQVNRIVSKGLPGLAAEYPVYCQTARQAHANASTMTPTQTPFTADFESLRPKKNMQAAPKAGNSGMIQM